MTRLFDGPPASQPCWRICQLMNNQTNHTYRYTSAEPPGQSHPPQVHIDISNQSNSLNSSHNRIYIYIYLNRKKVQKSKTYTTVLYNTRSHRSGHRAQNIKVLN